MKVDEREIRRLNHLARNYDTTNKAIVSTKNRIQALMPDMIVIKNGKKDFSCDTGCRLLETTKEEITKDLKRCLKTWPIWKAWLKKVPGIGPFIAANLILLFNYKFIPICPKCENEVDKKDGTYFCPKCDKSIKGDGNLIFKVKEKDFPTVSKWWSYMGKNIDKETGRVVKRKSGVQSNWSSKGKMICFQIAEQFNMKNGEHPYKQFLLDRKRIQKNKYPDYSKGRIHGMALNETSKLFLSHFWHVSREIDGKKVINPWIQDFGGHPNIIPPYYWNGNSSNKTE